MSEIKGAARPFGVAVDYDDTFSACPETWGRVVEVLRDAGALVVCVTFRKPNSPVTDFPGDVYYTSGTAKAEYMHAQGIDIHVWVDDMPELVGINPEKRAMREAMGLPIGLVA